MKHVLFALLALVVTMALPFTTFAVYQDLYGGVTLEYTVSDDDSAQGYVISPYADYWFEHELNKRVLLELGAGPKFSLFKTEADDESLNSFEFYIEPEVEWTITEMFSFDELLGVYFLNEKVSDDRESGLDFETTTTVTFGTLEEDLPGISPWEGFMKGYEVNGIYWRQLYSKYADEKADELDHSIGIEATYAYFNEPQALMFAPSLAVTKHLNDAMDESLAIDAGLNIAKDLSKILAVSGDLTLSNVKVDDDTDAENTLGLSVDLILNAMAKTEITANANYSKNLSDDDIDPVFGISLDVNVEIFVKE